VSYVAVRFVTGAADADAWSDALLDAGALAVDLADAAAGTADEQPLYGEPGERAPQPDRWITSRLVALFAHGCDTARAVEAAARALGVPAPPHETSAVADADWVRATQSQFAPIQAAERIWIVPSWCDPIDRDAINVVLDPGLAFGTGSHPTTRLCIRWLADALPAGARVLDYGCGSGILAIVAAKLGARVVVGCDVDAQAIVASRANARRNRVRARFVAPGDARLARAKPFDVVVANILANPLRLLAPALAARVRAGGRILLSGVLAPQADDVIAAYSPWFRIGAWRDDDGWVALEGTRTDATPAARHARTLAPD
jgi:ribosomal protein L11 methyltransferase